MALQHASALKNGIRGNLQSSCLLRKAPQDTGFALSVVDGAFEVSITGPDSILIRTTAPDESPDVTLSKASLRQGPRFIKPLSLTEADGVFTIHPGVYAFDTEGNYAPISRILKGGTGEEIAGTYSPTNADLYTGLSFRQEVTDFYGMATQTVQALLPAALPQRRIDTEDRTAQTLSDSRRITVILSVQPTTSGQQDLLSSKTRLAGNFRDFAIGVFGQDNRIELKPWHDTTQEPNVNIFLPGAPFQRLSVMASVDLDNPQGGAKLGVNGVFKSGPLTSTGPAEMLELARGTRLFAQHNSPSAQAFDGELAGFARVIVGRALDPETTFSSAFAQSEGQWRPRLITDTNLLALGPFDIEVNA